MGLIDLLRNLRKISIFPNSLPKQGGMEDILGGEKGHLIYLMPEIVDCTSTKETDLRDELKTTLLEYNKILLGQPLESD